MLPWMLLSFFIFLLIQVVNLIPSYVMSYIVDTAIPNGNLIQIVLYVILFISIPLLTGVGNSYYVYVTAIKCREYAYDYNQRIFDRLLRQNMTYLNTNSGTELSAKAMQEVSSYVYLWICTIPQTIAAILAGAIILVALGSIHIWVAAIQLLFVIALILPIRWGGKLMKQNSKQLFGAVVKGRAVVSEAFNGIRTIKTMCLENKVLARYRDIYEKANAIFGKAIAIETVTTSGIRDFLSAVFLEIAFIQCAVYVSMGRLSIGLLITTISLLPRFYMGITNLVGTNLSFKKQIGQYDEILSYMDMDIEDEGELSPEKFLSQSLVFRKVGYAYEKDRPILDQFDLTLSKGTWLGIEGKSGIGKSTVMDLIMRLYHPDSGSIELDGKPVTDLSLNWYRNHIAYVAQEPFLFNGTIRENIELICGSVQEGDLIEALKGANIYELIQSLPDGLDTQVGDNGVSFSGGEKQRLAVAIAFMKQRPLLLLDEATSNMDRESEERIREYLHQKVLREGLTVVSVSHRKDFHQRADVLLQMEMKN